MIPAPDAPWIECTIVDVSDTGPCLDVGALAVPKIFGLAFTAGGEVLRVCLLVWRRGERIGARFVSARELRDGLLEAGTPIRSLCKRRPASDVDLGQVRRRLARKRVCRRAYAA